MVNSLPAPELTAHWYCWPPPPLPLYCTCLSLLLTCPIGVPWTLPPQAPDDDVSSELFSHCSEPLFTSTELAEWTELLAQHKTSAEDTPHAIPTLFDSLTPHTSAVQMTDNRMLSTLSSPLSLPVGSTLIHKEVLTQTLSRKYMHASSSFLISFPHQKVIFFTPSWCTKTVHTHMNLAKKGHCPLFINTRLTQMRDS